VYEFLRNKVLNANEFFANKAGINRPPFTQNQYGATVGGAPIKDKLFAFFSWESFRLRQGSVFTTTVPTCAERGGCSSSGFGAGPGDFDFSALGFPIFDPLTVPVNNPDCQQPILGRNCAATQFAGNVIPRSRLNSTSAFLFNLVPNPTNNLTANNFVKATGLGGDSDEFVPRVDYTINDKSHIFGRYSYWKLADLPRDPFGTGLCQDRCTETYHTHAGALGYNYDINPTTIFDLSLSISRFVYLRTPVNAGFDMTKQGWPAVYNGAVPDIERTPLTPCFGISDPTITCSQGQSAISDSDTQFNFSPRVTMIRGRHTFVAGGQFELSYDNYLQTNTGGGLISFNGLWTRDRPKGFNTFPGSDFADFILGYGLGLGSPLGNQTSGAVNISGPVAGKQFYRAAYFGDTWKVSNKLTLNLGIRYDLQGPWSERHDRITYFNPNAANAGVTGCSGAPGTPCPGDLFLVGTGVNPSRNNLPLDKHNWMPRLGVAYSFSQKTVIRAGYGIFFIPNFVSFGVNPYIDPVSSSANQFVASINSLTPASSLSCQLDASFNCIPGTGPFGPALVPPPGRTLQPQALLSAYALDTLRSYSATGYTVQKNGWVQQWNVDLQRELPAGFFLDIAYAGSKGVHLPLFNPNINQIPDSFISQAASQFAQGLPVTIAQIVPAANYPFSPALPGNLSPGVLVQGQLDRPVPQYAGLNLNGQGCCGSIYHSLQATAQKRFVGGGTLLVAYTNAKLLSTADTLTSWLEGSGTGGVAGIQDWNNLKNERSLASQDVSQRLVISYVLDLPFGHGKKYLSGYQGLADKFVSGWGVDGVTTLQRGFPLKITYGGGTPLSALPNGLGIGGLRPNVISGCNTAASGSDKLAEWFNTACFTLPPPYGFGTESRVDPRLRQDGFRNFDFAIFKRTPLPFREGTNIEFRAEFFNIFNHPLFGAPGTSAVFGIDPKTLKLVQTNPNFGVVSRTLANANPRQVQFALKVNF